MPLVAVGEVRRVDQAERRGGQQLAFLAFARGGFHQFRGVPLAEVHFQPLRLQPALQQVNLRGFPRAIQALDRNQPAGEIEFGKGLHVTRRRLSRVFRNTTVFCPRVFGAAPPARGAPGGLISVDREFFLNT